MKKVYMQKLGYIKSSASNITLYSYQRTCIAIRNFAPLSPTANDRNIMFMHQLTNLQLVAGTEVVTADE